MDIAELSPQLDSMQRTSRLAAALQNAPHAVYLACAGLGQLLQPPSPTGTPSKMGIFAPISNMAAPVALSADYCEQPS